jgi:antitoxin component YwqK of YwqJK toxin-antitoxin module
LKNDVLQVNKFSSSEVIESIGNFANSKKEGKWLYFDKYGHKLREIDYISGEFHGVYIEFRQGKIMSQENYQEGRLSGFAQYYNYICGTINAEGYYKSGKKEGLWMEYNKGELLSVKAYSNGKEAGLIYQLQIDDLEPPEPENDPNNCCCHEKQWDESTTKIFNNPIDQAK